MSDYVRYARVKYSKKKINEASSVLVDLSSSSSSRKNALEIVNNWRSSHSWPMNVIYEALKRNSSNVGPRVLVVQRLKRIASIQRKLPLLKKKGIVFTEMQDIGGCRAIVKNIKDVYALAEQFKNSQIKHKLVYVDDYIKEPKIKSGYRGVHLIYSYYSDRNKNYNGHRIEIQLRTPYQHAWATAVETVDTFTNQFLKSNKGSKAWKKFFKIMATVIAIRENTKPALNTPIDIASIKNALSKYDKQLTVIRSIKETGRIYPKIKKSKGAHYFLIVLDSIKKTAVVKGFTKADSQKAAYEYLRFERRHESARHIDAVLVSTETIEMLQKAYTNYFSDMDMFARIVEETLS